MNESYAQRLHRDFAFNKIVVQPTPLCNLNCSYCYLGNRRSRERMSDDIAKAIANSLEEMRRHMLVIWHGGEPLAMGHKAFERILGAFEGLRTRGLVTHSLQTNATLVSDEWCSLFKKFEVKIGVSIDGPPDLDSRRVDWSGNAAHNRITVGVGRLREHKIPFSVICVLSDEHLTRADEVYGFIKSLGATSLGFNSPEREGSNDLPAQDFPELSGFWSNVFQAWRMAPSIRVRELAYVLSWMDGSVRRHTTRFQPKLLDLIPTISCNGDVVVLSPEFSGVRAPKYNDFIIGNISDRSLTEMVSNLPNISYYREYVDGVDLCERECQYFSFCGGGQASNKYFEHERLDVTETAYCRNMKKRLVDAVVEALN